MTDRSRNTDPDDNLDYLDAGLPPDDQATTRIGPEEPAGPGRGTSTTAPGSPAPPLVYTSETDVARRDSSWNWPITNLIGLIVVVAVNYAANYFEFNGNSTGDIVNRDPVPFQPAGWVFSIWGVIYLLLAVFVVYGLLPAGRYNPRLQRISPLFLISNIANTVWIVFWHWEQVAAALGTMVVLIVALHGIYIGVRYHGNPFRRGTRESVDQPGWLERIALRLPFSVYIGWIWVALLANAMVWLNETGRDSGLFSLNWWAVIFMVVAALVAAVFMVTSHDGVVALVMAVAFAGIADRNWGSETAVSVVAGFFAVLALVIAVVSALIAFDKTHNRPLPGSHLWRRTEPVS